MAQTEFALAASGPRKASDFSGPNNLRSDLIVPSDDYRREQSELLIGDFNRKTFKPSESGFLRIGAGSLGGQGARARIRAPSPGKSRIIRRFPAFASRCRLLWSWPPMPSINSWQKTICWISLCNATTMPKFCRNFWHLLFPSSCMEDLKSLPEQVEYPLARALFQPSRRFANTSLSRSIRNLHAGQSSPPIRRASAELIDAIKRVYASTFSPSRQTTSRHSLPSGRRKMAVIVQQCGLGARPALLS